MTKIADIRGMTPDQLAEQLLSLKKEQFNLRFQRASGQLEKTSRVRAVRRDIARVQTVMGQKTRGETVVAKAKTTKEPVKAKAKARAKAKK